MGQADRYVHRDHNVICDRCGFKRKRSNVQYTWDNLLVCFPECWEIRHPQDFVRGIADKQSVADARPDYQTMQQSTTLGANASAQAITITVSSASHITKYCGIGIELDPADSGLYHWTFVSDDPSGTTITLNDRMPSAATSGNTVLISVGDRFLTTNEVTATQL